MKKQVIAIIVLGLIIIFGAGSALSYVYYSSKGWANAIYPKVYIQKEDLTGKTKEEAQKILNEKYSDILINKNIVVKLDNKEYTLDYKKLKASFNIDEAINEAFDYGKNSNMFERYKLIKNPKEKNIKLKFNSDSAAVKDFVSGIEKDVAVNPVNGSFSLQNGNFVVVPDKKGRKLKSDELTKDIISKINDDLKDTKIEIQAPIEIIEAKLTAEKLRTIDSKISGFSSDYNGSIYERSNNIALATKTINGTLIMPGDTFSFNNVVGERTSKKGYLAAPVIIGNKVDSGLGGGICQVSTCLYNAVIRANIKASERNHHSLPSHYIGLGMDATVDYGNLDYKFINTLNYPVYIEGFTKNGIIYFNIYSNSSLKVRTYDIANEVYATTPFKTKYIDDPTLPQGQTVQEQPPFTGYKVKVYKFAYENGKAVEKELISNDTYSVVDEVIRRGTKKSN